MHTTHRVIAAACLFVLATLPVFAAEDIIVNEPSPERAVEIAVANGMPEERSEAVVEALDKVYDSKDDEEILVDEVVKLSRTNPGKTAAIAAASTALVPRRGFALNVAEAASLAAKWEAPAIAAALAAAAPELAPHIAGRAARAVPWAAIRITKRVAKTVPESVEGTMFFARKSLGLERAVISAVPLIKPTAVYSAAYLSARQAGRKFAVASR